MFPASIAAKLDELGYKRSKVGRSGPSLAEHKPSVCLGPKSGRHRSLASQLWLGRACPDFGQSRPNGEVWLSSVEVGPFPWQNVSVAWQGPEIVSGDRGMSAAKSPAEKTFRRSKGGAEHRTFCGKNDVMPAVRPRQQNNAMHRPARYHAVELEANDEDVAWRARRSATF